MKLRERRQIKRPLAEVFAYAANFANTEEWDPGVVAARQIGDGPVMVGSVFEVVAGFGGSEIPMLYEITELEENEKVVLRGSSSTVDALDVIEFEAREGGTLVDYSADLDFKNWIRFISPIVAPVMKRVVGKRALDGLVEALEQ